MDQLLLPSDPAIGALYRNRHTGEVLEVGAVSWEGEGCVVLRPPENYFRSGRPKGSSLTWTIKTFRTVFELIKRPGPTKQCELFDHARAG